MTMPMKMTITMIDYIENDDGNVNEDVHDDSRNDDMMMTMTKNDRRENDNNHVDNDDNDDGDNRGGTSDSSRELKQPRRRRLRRRHLKSEVALLRTLSRLFHLVQFVKCWQFFLELSSKNGKWGTFRL